MRQSAPVPTTFSRTPGANSAQSACAASAAGQHAVSRSSVSCQWTGPHGASQDLAEFAGQERLGLGGGGRRRERDLGQHRLAVGVAGEPQLDLRLVGQRLAGQPVRVGVGRAGR